MLEMLRSKVDEQPFARRLGMRLVELDEGYSKVVMEPSWENRNFFGTVHGGAIFSLIDQAFGAAANSHGAVAVAISVTVDYLRPASPDETLYAEAREVSRTRRISTYNIEVRNQEGQLKATCLAMAYRRDERIQFE
ncbi:MAG: PaaI family thioesterase [Methanothrix sp.]|nr:PaaI family thioesterase [Methanothrix sp.]MBC7080167.1 PaaI family thioesterase [Methanothrix sp.]NPU87893.1 PaaI family thioesterase [Methanothrix sp.]